MDTTHKELREIDQRIAALNLSLTKQMTALNLSLNGKLTDIQSDLDHHRWQTHYYRRTILSRLARLESKRKDNRFPLLKIMDTVIIIRIIILAGLAATGVVTWSEVGKLVIN